ncbi:hypothetical protein T439DRAFT_337735 [Meredithblackwellia eburnea MCA 4105]
MIKPFARLQTEAGERGLSLRQISTDSSERSKNVNRYKDNDPRIQQIPPVEMKNFDCPFTPIARVEPDAGIQTLVKEWLAFHIGHHFSLIPKHKLEHGHLPKILTYQVPHLTEKDLLTCGTPEHPNSGSEGSDRELESKPNFYSPIYDVLFYPTAALEAISWHHSNDLEPSQWGINLRYLRTGPCGSGQARKTLERNLKAGCWDHIVTLQLIFLTIQTCSSFFHFAQQTFPRCNHMTELAAGTFPVLYTYPANLFVVQRNSAKLPQNPYPATSPHSSKPQRLYAFGAIPRWSWDLGSPAVFGFVHLHLSAFVNLSSPSRLTLVTGMIDYMNDLMWGSLAADSNFSPRSRMVETALALVREWLKSDDPKRTVEFETIDTSLIRGRGAANLIDGDGCNEPRARTLHVFHG